MNVSNQIERRNCEDFKLSETGRQRWIHDSPSDEAPTEDCEISSRTALGIRNLAAYHYANLETAKDRLASPELVRCNQLVTGLTIFRLNDASAYARPSENVTLLGPN